MPRLRPTPNTRRNVASRLQQLQRDGAAAEPDAPLAPRPYAKRVFLLACVVIVLGTGWVVRQQLVAPPHALSERRLSDGTMVRLLAVTREAPQSYTYQPANHPVRRLAAKFGRRLGWPTVTAVADVPAQSVTLWLLVDRPLQLQTERLQFNAGEHDVYTAEPPQEAVTGGQSDWGPGTLVWVSLTNSDRSAARLTASVPLGAAGEAANFTIDGPAEAPEQWELASDYPLTSGNKDAVIRLQQLRRPQPEVMGLSLDGSPPPTPQEDMLLADIDVSEPTPSSENGLWLIDVDEAETRQGERLTVVRDTAGLIWLTRGRSAAGIDAVRLKVAAEKQVRGVAMVVFRNLELPKVKETAHWTKMADQPFPGGQFVAQTCERPSADKAVITIDARAPAGTEFATFAYADGLDQAGHKLRNLPGTSLPPDQLRTSAAGNSWHWTFEGRVFPDTTTIALAFRVIYVRIAKRATATFTGPVQPLLSAEQVAACGLVLEPFSKDNEAAVRVKVAAITPETAAAQTSLQPGDEILRVDGLPPGLWGRAVFRHRPGESLDLTFRRDGKVYHGQVKLDRAGG